MTGLVRGPSQTQIIVEQKPQPPKDPKQMAYEESRAQHREDHPIPDTRDLFQVSELRLMPYRDRIKKATPQQLEAHPEFLTKPKIYIASKAKHRPRWRSLRDSMGYNIISQWIDTDDSYIDTHDQLDYTKLWRSCVQDVKDCDVLALYVEPGDHLKGALVELGIALGLNKEIIVTGDLGDNGSWHYHDKVEVSDKSIEDLMVYIYGS